MNEAIFEVIRTVFQQPPLPYDPANQSLKVWAMYCLRDRGFMVIYAQNADFAVETRSGEKLYFKVTTNPEAVTGTCNWIVWDAAAKMASVIAPSS